MSEQKEGTANVTADELEAAMTRPHPMDTKPFMNGFKKLIKDKYIRINKYSFKQLHDSWMLKLNIEKFVPKLDGQGKKVGSKSMGPRWIKGFLSEVKKVEFEKILDAIPRKTYTDTRDNSQHERPERIDKIHRDAPTDLDLENLWDTTIKE